MSATSCQAQQQAIWQEYVNNPNNHPNIPNNSFAGYYYGESPIPTGSTLPDGSVLPTINVKTWNADATKNAKGNGVTDDTAAIQAAIDSVGASGGVVYLPTGTYILSGQLKIGKNKTILRGQSRTGVILRFTRSLNQVYGVTNNGSTDAPYADKGGLIEFKNPVGGGGDWAVAGASTTVTSNPSRGASSFTVASANGFSVGQVVLVRVYPQSSTDLSITKYLLGNTTWADNFFNDPEEYADSNGVIGQGAHMAAKITAISGNTITIKEPLRFDLRAVWNPGIGTVSGAIYDSGLQNVTMDLERGYDYSFSQHRKWEEGWNGVEILRGINCFVQGVTVIDPDGLAFGLNGGKNNTVTDITVQASAANRMRHHHGIQLGGKVYDSLYQNVQIESRPFHGIAVDGYSAGNVCSKCTLMQGTIDYHRLIAHSNIFTEITIYNTGLSSGPSGGGPKMGARNAHWNINAQNSSSYMIGEAPLMPNGAVIGAHRMPVVTTVHEKFGDSGARVEASGTASGRIPNPPNLYEAQKALRLGQSVPNIAPVPVGPAFTETAYDFEFGGGAINGDIVGQNNWSLANALNTVPGDVIAVLEEDPTHPEGITRVIEGRKDAMLRRQSDGTYFFTPFAMDESAAQFRYDLRNGVAGGTAASSFVSIGNAEIGATTPEGVSVNWTGSRFNFRQGEFGQSSVASADMSAAIGRGDWVRVQATINFNTETLSLAYRNLTRGETSYTPVSGLQNIAWSGRLLRAYTWDRIQVRLGLNGAVDNVIPNVAAIGTDHDPGGSGINQSPSVFITSPQNGATFTAPANVTINTNATDADGAVSRVEFFSNGTKIGEQTISPYSFAWNGVAAGTYALTARATDNDGAQTASSTVNITVNGAPATTGTLTGTGAAAVTTSSYGLSTLGTLDWAHWGLSTATSFNHKSSGATRISNFTKIGIGTISRAGTNAAKFSWTGGTPTASATNTGSGVYIPGVGRGFEITTTADTTARTLTVYCGGFRSTGRLTASLSDGSAPNFVESFASDTTFFRVYTLRFKAGSAGQTLKVRWEATAGTGNTSLQAATLAP